MQQDPSAILVVPPTQDAAMTFSKERFAPNVAASSVLFGLQKLNADRGANLGSDAILVQPRLYGAD